MPLAKYWGKMDPSKKQKWITIAKRYPSMTLLEKQNIQKSIQEFISLNPNLIKKIQRKYKEINNVFPERTIKIKKKWKKYKGSSKFKIKN